MLKKIWILAVFALVFVTLVRANDDDKDDDVDFTDVCPVEDIEEEVEEKTCVGKSKY